MGLEPTTQWLTATCSTDWATSEQYLYINLFSYFFNIFNSQIPRVGLEPTRRKAPGSKPGVSTSSTTSAELLRGQESNLRPPGYEPSEIPLLHPASSQLIYLTKITLLGWQDSNLRMLGSKPSALPAWRHPNTLKNSGWRDSNSQPSAWKADALANWATPAYPV